MLRLLIASFIALGLAACADAGTPEGDPVDSATGYYQPGSEVPASADLSRGDVPRDGYGRPYTYEGLGEELPEFTGALASGASFSSTLLEGRWTVIEVWGIWCHDSRNDATYAAALSRALSQDPDVDFMSIHTPPNAENAERAYRNYGSVSAWFEDKGWSFPTVVDEDASIRDLLRIRWTPTYLVIAPDLTVQGFRTGLADAGDMAVKDFVKDIAETRRTWSDS
ncbi:MAG: hypothetical protein Hens2KO_04940 [Henriciella sp.]